MDDSSNIFSYCLGALALISAVLSTVIYYRSYLPGVQIKLLDEVLRETRGIYEAANADGLLPTETFRTMVECRLSKLEDIALVLRERAYRATTPLEEYLALVRGLSWEVMKKSQDVKKLRAFVLTASEEERRRRDSRNFRQQTSIEGRTTDIVMRAPISCRGENLPTQRERNLCHRPGSCPPSLDCTLSSSLPFPAQLENRDILPSLTVNSLPSTSPDSDTASTTTLVSKPQSWSFIRPLFFLTNWGGLTTGEAPNGNADRNSIDIVLSQV